MGGFVSLSTVQKLDRSCNRRLCVNKLKKMNERKWLIVEPFYGGSHKQMLTTLLKDVPERKYTLITMSARKWHWRARCSAIHIWTRLPRDLENYETLFCSSVLPLSELVGICPKLSELKVVVYFHENQLIYPKRTIRERDYQYGYNQVTTCLASDIVLFNSHFNRNSFLSNINRFLNMMPDYKPRDIYNSIIDKTEVLYYPMDFTHIDAVKLAMRSQMAPEKLCIVWPHRWEFDKNPKLFFDALYALQKDNVEFEVIILGESNNEIPEEFEEAKERLEGHIKHFGYSESIDTYYELLCESHIIVSTSLHEFFGVSMLEGVRMGCVPLVPDRLVYPEIYPRSCIYRSEIELVTRLKEFCTDIKYFMEFRDELIINTEQYDAVNLVPKYFNIMKNYS